MLAGPRIPIIRPVQLIIPFATGSSPQGQRALEERQRQGQWRVLPQLLQRMHHQVVHTVGEHHPQPPHEHVLAAHLAVHSGRQTRQPLGAWPAAAFLARHAGLEVGPDTTAWGLMTPCHWHVGTDQVSMGDPDPLRLDEATSRALFDAFSPLLAGDGLELLWLSSTQWLVRSAPGLLMESGLAGMTTASLDRVIGRNVDPWLSLAQPDGLDPEVPRRVRRLQSEAQMLWHSHPVNAQREAQGRLPINSFWLSGCGRWPMDRTGQALAQGLAPTVDNRLRSSALAEDWAAWSDAWDALEAEALAPLLGALDRGEAVHLHLCGERAALHLSHPVGAEGFSGMRAGPGRPAWWQRLRSGGLGQMAARMGRKSQGAQDAQGALAVLEGL